MKRLSTLLVWLAICPTTMTAAQQKETPQARTAPNAQSSGLQKCAILLSTECRTYLAAWIQAELRAAAPNMRVDGSGEIIEFTDSTFLTTEESRLEFRNVILLRGLDAALCKLAFKKVILQASFDASGTTRGEYQLDCPGEPQASRQTQDRAGNPKPIAEGLAQGVPETLGGMKQRYENKAIIVDGTKFLDHYLLEWDFAESDGPMYRTDARKHLPLSYKGQEATVIVVQLDPLSRNGQDRVNALGEVVAADDIVDPYVDVVVRFGDGTVAMKTGYPKTLDVHLAAERESASAEMAEKLPSVVGAKIYAVAFSKLYQLTSTLDDLKGTGEIFNRLRISEVPLLEPLTIETARYLAEDDAVVLKLRLPNGKEALAFTSSIYLNGPHMDSSFLSKIAGNFLTAVPPNFTAQEIEAIKGMKIFRGMSREALAYAVGLSEKENDWGRGGKQLIFFSGKLLVYLDASEKVADWQNLE